MLDQASYRLTRQLADRDLGKGAIPQRERATIPVKIGILRVVTFAANVSVSDIQVQINMTCFNSPIGDPPYSVSDITSLRDSIDCDLVDRPVRSLARQFGFPGES